LLTRKRNLSPSLLIILVPFERVAFRLGVPVQSLSLFGIVAAVFFPLIVFNGIKKSKLVHDLSLFFSYLIVVSLVNAIFEPRLLPYITRQTIALYVGFSQFMVLRYIFLNTSEGEVFRVVLTSFYLTLIPTLWQLFHREYRIQSFYTEPSHYGQFLAFIVWPTLFLLRNRLPRVKYYVLILLWLVSLLLTFSTTSVVRLFFVIFGILFFSKNITLKMKIRVVFVVLLLVITVYFYVFVINSNNYMANIVRFIIAASKNEGFFESSVSISDRAVLFLLLRKTQLSLRWFFGHGLGAEALEYQRLLPASISDRILSQKQFGYYIASLYGKIFVGGGILGLAVLLWLLMKFLRKCSYFKNLDVITGVLFGVIAYGMIGLGAFPMVELWYWLAYADSELLKARGKLSSKVGIQE